MKFYREKSICTIQLKLDGTKGIDLNHIWIYNPLFIDDIKEQKKKEIFREICSRCGFVNFINPKTERR